MNRKESSDQNRKEEIRGLFVLGLLAVLSSIRVQFGELIVEVGQVSFDIIPWIDFTIVLWSLYAFFMVLGLSEDLLGKSVSSSFREISTIFLGVNYVILVILSLLAFVSGFFPRLPYVLVLLFALACYVASVRLRKQKKPSEEELKEWWKSVKSSAPRMLMAVLALCILLTIFGVEKYIIPYFIIGCVAISLYIVLKEKA